MSLIQLSDMEERRNLFCLDSYIVPRTRVSMGYSQQRFLLQFNQVYSPYVAFTSKLLYFLMWAIRFLIDIIGAVMALVWDALGLLFFCFPLPSSCVEVH